MTSLGEERTNLSAFRMFVRFLACFVLSASAFSWCHGLGRAVACDYGTPWTFLLPFPPDFGIRQLCLGSQRQGSSTRNRKSSE